MKKITKATVTVLRSHAFNQFKTELTIEDTEYGVTQDDIAEAHEQAFAQSQSAVNEFINRTKNNREGAPRGTIVKERVRIPRKPEHTSR